MLVYYLCSLLCSTYDISLNLGNEKREVIDLILKSCDFSSIDFCLSLGKTFFVL